MKVNSANRVLKGGSYFDGTRGLNVACRYWSGPVSRFGVSCFRVVVRRKS